MAPRKGPPIASNIASPAHLPVSSANVFVLTAPYMDRIPDPCTEPPLNAPCISCSFCGSKGVIGSSPLFSGPGSIVGGILSPDSSVADTRYLSTISIKCSGVMGGSVLGTDFRHSQGLFTRTIVRGVPKSLTLHIP